MNYDVAIIGGGPAGSTTGSLLKKYRPDLRVLILEREQFPRDHVGESQLPPISKVLNEMGCWDKVEAADFPIKIGATYRWGKSPELWDFEFYPSKNFVDEPRPAQYAGQRLWTAFQVDRSIYDTILLDHAEELGCEVRQQTKVQKVLTEGDSVSGLLLEDGSEIHAQYYIDASGHSGILRRAMGVAADSPTSLQNIAIWDYWNNAEWAVGIGIGGTRVQVMSLGYGWLWFIPIQPTRTSLGLVIPAEYYKRLKQSPEEIYLKAVQEDPLIADLTQNASREGNLQTTKDWSFLAARQVGENWFLAGESAGFADPILAAGLSLAQTGAREAAYTILELFRGKLDGSWLKDEYQQRQTRRIGNHIRFADYWYTANAQFADLKDFTAQIAQENGLDLSPDKSWAWLAQGGFIDEDASFGAAGFSIDQLKDLGDFMHDVEVPTVLTSNNVFKLHLRGAQWRDLAYYREGRIEKVGAYVRNGKTLPLVGVFEAVVDILQRDSRIPGILECIRQLAENNQNNYEYMTGVILKIHEAFEAMISDGWIEASYDRAIPLPPVPHRLTYLQWNKDRANRIQ